VRLLRDPALRWCRALGVAYFVLAVAFTVTGGKPYYLGGTFALLLAAGAQPVIEWLRRGRPRVRRALLVAAVLLSLTAAPVTLPPVPVADLHNTPVVKLNYDAGETIGWPAYVREIANVFASLPATRRRTTVVLASNYGEAGAVDRSGPADGLPAVYSGHNGYWYWGPPSPSASIAARSPRSAGRCATQRASTTTSMSTTTSRARRSECAPIYAPLGRGLSVLRSTRPWAAV
jgi:hypothetical protein